MVCGHKYMYIPPQFLSLPRHCLRRACMLALPSIANEEEILWMLLLNFYVKFPDIGQLFFSSCLFNEESKISIVT